MIVDNRQKRSRFGSQRFLFSLFCTFFFLSLYLLGLYYIPAPETYIKQLKVKKVFERKFFSSVFDWQNQVGFILSFLFSIVSSIFWGKKKTEERQKIENTKAILLKILKPNFVAFAGVYSYWNSIKSSSYLIFLTYFSFFVSNCVFELIIELLNEYAICRGFDLLFFVNIFPFKTIYKLFSSLLKTVFLIGNYSDLRRSISLLPISLIVYFFISISNKKWEFPVEINTIDLNDNYIKYSPTFLLRTNFNVFSLNFISSSVFLFSVLLTSLLESLKKKSKLSFIKLIENFFITRKNFASFSIESSSFKKTFFAIFSAKNPFSDLYNKINKNRNFFPAIICWLLVVHFINWLNISYSQLNSREISERLEKRGVYLDGVYPGKETRKWINNLINTLVASWAFNLTILAICFDNVNFSLLDSNKTSSEKHRLSFISSLGSVSIVIDLLKQIRKKYERSKFYD